MSQIHDRNINRYKHKLKRYIESKIWAQAHIRFRTCVEHPIVYADGERDNIATIYCIRYKRAEASTSSIYINEPGHAVVSGS
ncbi:hypothetical protein ACFSOV_02670 [Pedobacter petrophilus]|uniref:hypothetical protein n=1 Tax=Pedobacter petrophilus TaxID=1908241 RepID=UPI00362A0781